MNSEITSAWDSCLAAAQRYGSYVAALGSIDADIAASESSSSSSVVGGSSGKNPSGNKVVGAAGDASNATDREHIYATVKEMYANSREHWTADENRKRELKDLNSDLGKRLSKYGVKAVRDDDGWWHIDSVNGPLLYDPHKPLSATFKYHSGGIVGGSPELKQNEVLAVLEKGEAVLDRRKEQGLYRLIEFTTVLSDKFSKLMESAEMSHILGGSGAIFSNRPPNPSGSISNSSETHITFGDTYIYGSNEETVEKHRAITRQQANELFEKLNIKR